MPCYCTGKIAVPGPPCAGTFSEGLQELRNAILSPLINDLIGAKFRREVPPLKEVVPNVSASVSSVRCPSPESRHSELGPVQPTPPTTVASRE